MNPRSYRTWTSFADHPVFSDRRHAVTEWSSDPAVYDDLDRFPKRFDPEWYIHVDPKLPTEVQAEYAERDIRTLADFCHALEQEFGAIEHELFILDDFTVYVHVHHPQFELDLSAHDARDGGEILTIYVESPFDDELVVHHIPDGVLLLRSRIAEP